MKLAYFVHDLNDPAVGRRVAMLTAAGAEVRLAGFWRGEAPPAAVGGAPAAPLGRTWDGRLFARSLSVLGRVASHVVREAAAGAQVVMARNLEMLTLGALAADGRRLVYECLDIHRALLGRGVGSSLLRALETRLLARIDLLVVSSPAFLTHYFEARQDYRGLSLLVENKVLRMDAKAARPPAVERPRGPPWRIGWFGMLRCKRSLTMLAELARGSAGAIEVILRGKPALSELPDFFGLVDRTPGLSFAGPYATADLERIYGEVHFNWTIDYFEEGQNSRWLLPNRIYEGGFFGAVPIALEGVEAACWLAKRGVGLRLADPARDLAGRLAAMTPLAYAQLWRAVGAIPRGDLAADEGDARRLARALAGRS